MAKVASPDPDDARAPGARAAGATEARQPGTIAATQDTARRLLDQGRVVGEDIGRRAREAFGAGPTVPPADIGRSVAEDARTLIRAEIELAKAEVRTAVKTKALGAGLLAGAGVLGWLGLQGVLITIGLVLALFLPEWAAALIVTVVLLALAGVAALLGRKRLATPVSIDLTKQNLQEDMEWTKQHLPKR